MTFFSVLLTLLIERFVPGSRPQRQHRWFEHYCRRLGQLPFGQWLTAQPWGAAAFLLPPLLLIAWLQTLFNDLGGLPGLAFGILVLLYSLGPDELGEQVEAFTDARDGGDETQANMLAGEICPGGAPATEPKRSFAVAREVVVAACPRLVAPIFWFVVFGAVGAAAYRAIWLLSERGQAAGCPEEMGPHSDAMQHVADWAPARITAAGYAIAGNFDAVAHAWQTFDYVPDTTRLNAAHGLLVKTGLAALDTYPGSVADADGEMPPSDAGLLPPVVEDALALVWRSLAMWVGIVAAGSLVAALV